MTLFRDGLSCKGEWEETQFLRMSHGSVVSRYSVEGLKVQSYNSHTHFTGWSRFALVNGTAGPIFGLPYRRRLEQFYRDTGLGQAVATVPLFTFFFSSSVHLYSVCFNGPAFRNMVHLSSSEDPFASILAPPPGESPEAKEARERAEAEARRVNDGIDEQLRQERIALKKKKKPVKVLLLGQSESGTPTFQPPQFPSDRVRSPRKVGYVEKSALPRPSRFRGADLPLSDFQLQYARHEWAEDKVAWRAVIFLNLTRNVINVLDALLREMSLSDGDRGSSQESVSDSDWEPSSHTHVYRFTDKHRLLKLRLAPLRRVQADLEKRLGPGSQEVYSFTPAATVGKDRKSRARPREFGIISRNGWKSALEQLRPGRENDNFPEPVLRRRDEENYEIADVLFGCKEDMKNLWEDTVVQQILTHRKAHIEDSAGL